MLPKLGQKTAENSVFSAAFSYFWRHLVTMENSSNIRVIFSSGWIFFATENNFYFWWFFVHQKLKILIFGSQKKYHRKLYHLTFRGGTKKQP
jgi:hypothetical protein